MANTSTSIQQYIEFVEDLWESVLKEACGSRLIELLQQLRDLCSPDGQAPHRSELDVHSLIANLPLDEAVKAVRAFALYFQLINIVEQHCEQKERQLLLRATLPTGAPDRVSFPTADPDTFGALFAHLKQVN
jgi:phosphoenolpyruvate carboxylase